MWDISRIGQYGILLLGISSEASRRRGMEKVNSFREPVGLRASVQYGREMERLV